jgi:hypothetical protein
MGGERLPERAGSLSPSTQALGGIMPEPNGVGYRVSEVERRLAPDSRIDKGVALAEKHEYDLHGERGVYKAIEDLTNQLRWTQRALWTLAASVLVAALTIGMSGHP